MRKTTHVGDGERVFASSVELLLPLAGLRVEEVDLAHLRPGDDVLAARRECDRPNIKQGTH